MQGACWDIVDGETHPQDLFGGALRPYDVVVPPGGTAYRDDGGYHMTYADSSKASASRLAEKTCRAAYAERHPSLSRDGEAGLFDAYTPKACLW